MNKNKIVYNIEKTRHILLAIEEIKKDFEVINSILYHYGYYKQKEALIKGVPTIVYCLPSQKTGALYVWEGPNGNYCFKDYSPYLEGSAGTVIELVMRLEHLRQTKEDFKQALQKINEIIQGSVSGNSKDYANSRDEVLKSKRFFSEENHTTTTPLQIEILNRYIHYTMSTIEKYFPQVFNYLTTRKIYTIKKLDIFKIHTVYTNPKTGEIYEKTQTMIGIPYGITSYYAGKEEYKHIPEQGIELRSVYLDAKLKTMSYRKQGYMKTPTIILSTKRVKLAIFESFIDYLSLQSTLDNSSTDIAILNGTGLTSMFLDEMMPLIIESDKAIHKYYEEIYWFEQNDQAGKEVTLKIIPFFQKNYPLSNIYKIFYNENEDGFDINDLCKNELMPSEILKKCFLLSH